MTGKKVAGKKLWTKEEIRELKKLFRNNSTGSVAKKLKRSASSVQSKAASLGLTKTKSYLRSIGRTK